MKKKELYDALTKAIEELPVFCGEVIDEVEMDARTSDDLEKFIRYLKKIKVDKNTRKAELEKIWKNLQLHAESILDAIWDEYGLILCNEGSEYINRAVSLLHLGAIENLTFTIKIQVRGEKPNFIDIKDFLENQVFKQEGHTIKIVYAEEE
jgi:hypothetical protein